jgi:hypothetical protein
MPPQETRREYGFGSKVGATPDPITVPQVIKIGLAGFDCVRHPSGQDQHDLQTRLWKAEKVSIGYISWSTGASVTRG